MGDRRRKPTICNRGLRESELTDPEPTVNLRGLRWEMTVLLRKAVVLVGLLGLLGSECESDGSRRTLENKRAEINSCSSGSGGIAICTGRVNPFPFVWRDFTATQGTELWSQQIYNKYLECGGPVTFRVNIVAAGNTPVGFSVVPGSLKCM